MDTLIQDIRHAFRAIRRRPGWALIAIFTLAFGIGANTAVFTLISGALFRPPQVARPGELVWVNGTSAGRIRQSMSYPDYLQLRDRVPSLSGIVAWSGTTVSLGGSTPRRVRALVVSANYFDVLGVRPSLGRGFISNEDLERGAHPVVVLSYDLWKAQFGSNPRLLDSTIVVNGRTFTVAGVAREGFTGASLGEPAELFLPLGMLDAVMPGNGRLLDGEDSNWLLTLGRLAPGASLANAAAEASLVGNTLHVDREAGDRFGVQVTPMVGGLDPRNREQGLTVFGLLSIVPLLVLAVACANVASLLIAQGLARRRELAMRRALGATRGRLVRQMLTESVLLSGIGGAAGVVLATWLLALIIRLAKIPPEVSSVLVLDGRVLAATTVLAVLTGLVFGLLPALAATGPSLTPALKDGSGAGNDRRRHRLRDGFVVAQVAVSLLLLITAGLFLRTLNKALNVDIGFDPSGIAAVQFDLELQGYSAARRQDFRARLMERVAAVPGAGSAAYAVVVPMSGRSFGSDAIGEGDERSATRTSARWNEVSPGYFATMGIRFIAGRDFTASDKTGAPLVAVVNEELARRLWPGAEPVGQRMRLGGGNPLTEVVGVVRDGKYDKLVDAPRPFVFVPMAQRPADPGDVTLMVKTAGAPGAMVSAIVQMLQEMDRNLPVGIAEPLSQLVASRGAEMQRAVSVLLSVFGTLALALAALGIYGVTTHGVAQRTREIGIRMSLGARGADVLALFVRSAMGLAAVGVVIGVVVGAGVSKLLASFLFGLGATDAITFAAASVVLCLVVAVASYLPARRAVKVDPMIALRSE